MKNQVFSDGGSAAAPPFIDVHRNAVFLDLDGTLFALRDRPDLVVAEQAVTELVRGLSERMAGAVAIITGRSIFDADRILEGAVDAMAGIHGFERRRNGVIHQQASPHNLQQARDTLARLVGAGALDAKLEDKQHALALHYRHAPHQGELVRRAVEEVAARLQLRALHGKAVSELVPGGVTKGHAVGALMKEAPFAGRTPIAVGDDVTDEDAFIEATRHGGFGVRVGKYEGASAAGFVLADVAAVRDWLGRAT